MANPSIDTLRNVSIFADLDERDLKHLSQAFKERRFPAGHTIASEGKSGVGFFIIENGTATVTVGDHERATLGPGDSFGEIALIDGAARTATVTAASELTAYGLTSWEFKPIVESNGEIAWKMLEALARKLRAAEQRTS